MRWSRTPSCVLAALAGLGFAMLLGLTAQDAPPADEQPAPERPPATVDEQSKLVLARMSEHYRKAKSLSGRVTVTFQFTARGRTESFDAINEFRFSRPLSFATFNAEGQSDLELTCDGSRLLALVPSKKQYTEQPAPESMHALMEFASTATRLTGSPSAGMELILLRALFAEDPGIALTTAGTTVTYQGERMDGDRKVHSVRFAEATGHLDVWIDAGETPWVVRAIPAEPQVASNVVRVQMAMAFTRWSTKPIDPEAFQFVPPEGATQVDLETLMRRTPRGPAAPRVYEVGKTLSAGAATYLVARVDWEEQLAVMAVAEDPKERFLVVELHMRNDSPQPITIPPLVLIDADGKEITPWAKARLMTGGFNTMEKLGPGEVRAGLVVFDVPPDARYRLRVTDAEKSASALVVIPAQRATPPPDRR